MMKCHVTLPDESVIEVCVKSQANGIELFESVCKYLNISETDYFGFIRKRTMHLNEWLCLDQPLKKQLSSDVTPWMLKFAIKFYPAPPNCMKEDTAKYQVCLQIRDDLASGRLFCPLDTLALLGSYWLQSEFPDEIKTADEITRYLASVKNLCKFDNKLQIMDFIEKVQQGHEYQYGTTRSEANTQFLLLAATLPLYGVHQYIAKTKEGNQFIIGVTSTGIIEVNAGKLNYILYKWRSIKHIDHKKNQFSIKFVTGSTKSSKNGVSKSKIFLLATSEQAKAIWQNSIDHHVFFRVSDVNIVSARQHINNNRTSTEGKKSKRKKKPRFLPNFCKMRKKSRYEKRHSGLQRLQNWSSDNSSKNIPSKKKQKVSRNKEEINVSTENILLSQGLERHSDGSEMFSDNSSRKQESTRKMPLQANHRITTSGVKNSIPEIMDDKNDISFETLQKHIIKEISTAAIVANKDCLQSAFIPEVCKGMLTKDMPARTMLNETEQKEEKHISNSSHYRLTQKIGIAEAMQSERNDQIALKSQEYGMFAPLPCRIENDVNDEVIDVKTTNTKERKYFSYINFINIDIDSEITLSSQSSISDITDDTEDLCDPDIIDNIWSKYSVYESNFSQQNHFDQEKDSTFDHAIEDLSNSSLKSNLPSLELKIKNDSKESAKSETHMSASCSTHPWDKKSITSISKLDELDKEAIKAALKAQSEVREMQACAPFYEINTFANTESNDKTSAESLFCNKIDISDLSLHNDDYIYDDGTPRAVAQATPEIPIFVKDIELDKSNTEVSISLSRVNMPCSQAFRKEFVFPDISTSKINAHGQVSLFEKYQDDPGASPRNSVSYREQIPSAANVAKCANTDKFISGTTKVINKNIHAVHWQDTDTTSALCTSEVEDSSDHSRFLSKRCFDSDLSFFSSNHNAMPLCNASLSEDTWKSDLKVSPMNQCERNDSIAKSNLITTKCNINSCKETSSTLASYNDIESSDCKILQLNLNSPIQKCAATFINNSPTNIERAAANTCSIASSESMLGTDSRSDSKKASAIIRDASLIAKVSNTKIEKNVFITKNESVEEISLLSSPYYLTISQDLEGANDLTSNKQSLQTPVSSAKATDSLNVVNNSATAKNEGNGMYNDVILSNDNDNDSNVLTNYLLISQ